MIRYDVLKSIRSNPGMAGFLKMYKDGNFICSPDKLEELFAKGLLRRIVEGVLVRYECTDMAIRLMSIRDDYTRIYS